MDAIELFDKSDRIWILLAHRSGAKLLRTIGYSKDFKLLKEFNFPEGRLKNHEINTDDNGGLVEHEVTVCHLAETFAQDLAAVLRKGRTENRYERLVLIAEPRFLGVLRNCLDKETAKKISKISHHNYTNLSKNALTECLKDILAEQQAG